MHIKTLSAQNFRCFKDLQISFQPGFNPLIGNNMSGKTAVLDALRSCLALSVSPLGGNEIPLAKNDFRLTLGLLGDSAQMQPNFPCSILCELQYGENMIEFIKKYENDLNPTYCLSGYKYSETDRGVGMEPVVGGMNLFISTANTLSPSMVFKCQSLRIVVQIVFLENRTNVSKPIPELPKNQSRLFSYHSSLDDKSSLPSQRSWIERRTMSEVQRQLRKLPLLEQGRFGD